MALNFPRNLYDNIGKVIPDKLHLKIMFRYHMGKKLDFKNPKTYNEKLQWLKIYDRNPKYIELVDKFAVRKYISETIGEKYLIPLLGVYNSVEEIEWSKLPNKFVLKCTHGSTCNIICSDKKNLDISKAKIKLNKWIKRNWFWYGREWPYKDIRPKIICEKYMVDESGTELKDYKFFCFNGEPKAMFVATDRGIDTRFDFFDIEFNHIPVMQHYKNATKHINKPIGFSEMVNLARKLSKGIPHVRVDFYDINGKVYFGELTLFHFSGFRKFEPDKYDKIFGDWLELPKRLFS